MPGALPHANEAEKYQDGANTSDNCVQEDSAD
jgi:hypothetical protein